MPGCFIGLVLDVLLKLYPFITAQFQALLAVIATSESVSQCDFNLPCLSSPAGLRIAHLNCRSLLSIVDEVFDLFTRNHMDIVAVTETWLDPSIDDSEIFPYSSSIQ